MDLLTSRAMAVFGIQRLLPAQLVLHLSTMAAAFVPHVKIRIVVMYAVWSAMFPFVQLSFRTSVITVVSVCTVSGSVSRHCTE